MLLIEHEFDRVESEIITEGVGADKSIYIKGIFAQASVKNRNQRVYPESILTPEVNRYINEYVATGRALGELDHPAEGRSTIDLTKATHIITEMKQDGNNYVGKAKVLNTPMGNIVKGLLEGGVKIGVSTRGSGVVKKNKDGINEVQSGFKLHCVDIVYAPSAPDAMVDYVMESRLEDLFINNTELLQEFETFLRAKVQIKNAKREQRGQMSIDSFSKLLESFKV